MLNPVPMAKVAVVGPRSQLEATVEALHELGLLHIEDYQPGEEGFDLGSPLPQGAQVSERLLRVRGLLKGAQIPPPPPGQKFTPERLKALQQELGTAEVELSSLVEKRTALLDQLKKLDEEEAVLRRIEHFPLPLTLLSGYRSLATAAGFIGAEADPSQLRTIHAHLEYTASPETEGTFLFVAAPKAVEKPLQEALGKLKFQPLDVPSVDATPTQRLEGLQQERIGLQKAAEALEAQLADLRQRHAAAFYALDEYLALQADRAMAPVRFRTTPNAFMVEGWIPREQLSRVRNTLASATHNLAFLTELPTATTQPWKLRHAVGHGAAAHGTEKEGHDESHPEQEQPPVALRNPRAAGPYQLLTDTYSRPKYTEIDPTMFFFIGFPIFYGIMLGDIAYGVLLLILIGTGVFSKVFDFFGFQSKRAINRILAHSAIASILFGILYSEFFGMELFGHNGIISHFETRFGPIPYPLSRFENVKLLLFASLLIAAFHMLLGLFLGMRNAAVAHGWNQAIKHRGSWAFILTAATIAMLVGLPGMLELEGIPVIANATPFYYASLGLLVVGVVLLVMGAGAIALMELTTVLTNLLSYTRLVAIGLSSAGIALAGNKVAELPMEAGGVIGWAAAILILAFFHLLNLALGVVGPALHSLRLHYVEFFTKFYEGGGEEYAPFGAKRKYTVKEVKQA